MGRENSQKNYLVKDEIEITIPYSINQVEKLYKEIGKILRKKWPEILQIHKSDFHALDPRIFLRLSSKPIFNKGKVTVTYVLTYLKEDLL